MKCSFKTHMLSVFALGVFCILAAGSMDDDSPSSTSPAPPKTSAYVEAGRNVIGVYTTFGNVRLNATAQDVGCTPDDLLECTFYDADSEITASFYKDSSTPSVYRVCDYDYTFDLPKNMSVNEAFQMLEKKLGPGEFGQADVVKDQYFWGDWGNSVGAKAYQIDDGRIRVNVDDDSGLALHNQQVEQSETERDTKEKHEEEQELEQRLNAK